MPFVRFGDVVKELPNVDAPDALERAKTSPALRFALDLSRPENWWGTGVDPKKLLRIAREDGIPLAWLPRSEIVKELARAPDREARAAILRRRAAAIIADCKALLSDCTDPWLSGQVPLARAAVNAYEDGHFEAAMALAVSLGEPLAAWASTPRVNIFDSEAERDAWESKREKLGKYHWAELELGVVGADVSDYELKWHVLMAPIPRFFTPWRPESGTPRPEALSRHVVAHQSAVEHFSKDNALVALMLVTSILKDEQVWSDEVRASDEPSGAG